MAHGAAVADRRGGRCSTSPWRSAGRRRPASMQRFVDRAERAGARDAVHRAQHRGDAEGVRARPRRGARAVGRRAADARRHRRATPPRSATSGSGITSRCSQTFAQIQEIRTYYDFVSVHNDRYRIDGKYRQIMLSARELNSESLPNRNWINERLTFTHGYGVTLGPVNQVTPEGLPVLFIKDLPPQSTVDLKIDEPTHLLRRAVERSRLRQDARARVPLPERRRQRLHVATKARAACRCRASFRRVLLQHPLPLVQGCCSATTSPARAACMFYRRLSERVARIAPFLRYDADPYLVISDGRLSGCRTATRHRPLSVLDAGARTASTTSATR